MKEAFYESDNLTKILEELIGYQVSRVNETYQQVQEEIADNANSVEFIEQPEEVIDEPKDEGQLPEFMQEVCGTVSVWLEGFRGCYAVDGLDLVED